MARPEDEDEEPDPEEPVDPDMNKVYSKQAPPTIEHLSSLSDEELHHLMGHKKVISEARDGISEAMKLTGKAREHAENRVQDMFTPHIYGGEFKYLAQDAKDKVKHESGEDARNDTSPSSVL